MTWPKGSIFGPLLDACRVFAENGGQERAERVAQEARTLKLLTTVPRLRHYREAAPPPGSSAAEVFAHERIGVIGNGFLAVTLAELTAAEQQRRRRGIFSSTVSAAAGPDAFVVVWDHFTAPGFVLSGAHHAYTDPEHCTTRHHRQLHTAAGALNPSPSPRDTEWQ
ncbi:hypothetical protein OG389_00485 [Streptomyces sp. NBC_00435]|uniref:hypothetical protein n=1 Tax=Streptomyces sp. NBC_00435 TaxID=2903649 RepID=UPI002E2510B7